MDVKDHTEQIQYFTQKNKWMVSMLSPAYEHSNISLYYQDSTFLPWVTTAAGATAGYHHQWWVSLPTMPHQSVSAVKYPIRGTLLVSLVLMEGFFILLFHGSEHVQYLREENISSPQGPWWLILQWWAHWRTDPWPSSSGRGHIGEGLHQGISSRCALNEACYKDIFLFLSQTTSFATYN